MGRRSCRRGVVLGCVAGFLSPALLAAQPDTDRELPRLGVIVVVDGLVPRRLDALDDLFVGGFRRLLTDGAVLRNCHHDHAPTLTAPGHFAIFSGLHPGPVGVIDNRWFDAAQRRLVGAIEDSLSRITGTDRPAGSYRGVAASALGDWLREERRGARVFSIAGKDRSAILMAGRSADGAYWFDAETGRFVTSTYYRAEPHNWVDTYNDRFIAPYRHARWERFLADTTVYEMHAGADDVPGEEDISRIGGGSPEGSAPVFDHVLDADPGGSDQSFYRAFRCTPFLDAVTLELARGALVAEELGKDDVPDLLCIGLTSLDYVTHATGPDSQESMDVIVRLDRILGDFLDFLDAEIGENRYVFLLTADHGFAPLPEIASRFGIPGRRLGDQHSVFAARLDSLGRALCSAGSPFLRVDGEGVYLDRPGLERCGVGEARMEALIRSEAARESWIARVFRKDELLGPGPTEDPIWRRYHHGTHPGRSPDFIFCPTSGVLVGVGKRGTTHGSPYEYDTHVPALVLGQGIVAGDHAGFVATVDLVPTVARLLGLKNVPATDGRVLDEIVPTDLRSDPRTRHPR